MHNECKTCNLFSNSSNPLHDSQHIPIGQHKIKKGKNNNVTITNKTYTQNEKNSKQ